MIQANYYPHNVGVIHIFLGGDGGQAEHVEEIIGGKMPIEYDAPMPDYSIEGMGKPGEIVAIVAGTLFDTF